MKTCFLFPGQGAQYPGMGKDLWESSDAVKSLFECASDTTGLDVQKIIFEGSEEELKETDKTQISITLINLAVSAVLKEQGIESQGCAGFSLGEYAALVESGILSAEEIFPLVKRRGEFMAKASSASGETGMAAVIGLSPEKIDELIGGSGIEGLYVANFNSPIQVVLSGTLDGLAKGEPLCKEAGAKRFIKLKVSGAFHSPLMQEARTALEEELNKYTFNDPVKPIYSNVTGKIISSADEAKKLCGEQVTSSVRWTAEETSLINDGFQRCIEAGPGMVLSGLWKAFNKDIKCYPAGTLEQIQNL